MKKIYKKTKELFDNMKKDHVSEYTAQCSYYTILSFIPFIILLITLIQYTNIDQQVVIDTISKIVPSSLNELIVGIVKEVYSKSIGTISISVIFTLWSAGKGLFALTKGFHSIYDVTDKKRNSVLYLRLMALLQTIIFIVLITIGLVLLVFGNSLVSIIQNNFNELKGFDLSSSICTELIFILVTFIIFLFIYKFMPNQKVTLKSQIPGAIFGAITLNIISFVFSRYLDIFKGFSITYGSLTTLMLVMMWTYSCFYTMYLGAEINKIMKQNKEKI